MTDMDSLLLIVVFIALGCLFVWSVIHADKAPGRGRPVRQPVVPSRPRRGRR